MILLDTHALLWWLSDPDRLPTPARQRLDALVASGEAARVSAISCWEVAKLVDRRRLELGPAEPRNTDASADLAAVDAGT